MNQGVIRYLKDLVLKVEFDDDLPELNEILLAENPAKTPLLVSSLADGHTAICLNISGDRTLQKGVVVTRTGKSIEIPVGDALIGRVVDALGRPIDGLPPITGPDVQYRDIFKTPQQSHQFLASKP